MRKQIASLIQLVGAALVVATLACSGGGSDPAPQHVDFNGTWLLNDLASDNPDEVFRQAADNPANPSLPGGNRARSGERVSAILAAARVFRIAQDDSTVTVTGMDGTSLSFLTDGREVQRRFSGLGDTVTRARWKGEKLEIERKLEGGPRLVTTYELSDDGRQLILNFNMSSPGRSIKFRRVYDAAEGR
jgi:hypothetical protein